MYETVCQTPQVNKETNLGKVEFSPDQAGAAGNHAAHVNMAVQRVVSMLGEHDRGLTFYNLL